MDGDGLDPDATFDPFDMDREEFNPAMFIKRYSQDCNLQNLISRKVQVDSEILCLNSDLQNMLYDNYGKFINATTVVSSMKTDFQKMEGEMNLLHSRMEDVQSTSSTLLENLHPTQEKISHLLKAQDTMKRLVVLTNLVPTLRMHMNSGAFNVAARYYLKAKSTLKKYQHLPSFSGIMIDCTEIISEIKSSLLNKIDCEIYNKKELCETLNLLLQLGDSPETALKYFCTHGENYLTSGLNFMEEFWENVSKENHKKDKIISIIVDYINQCCSFIERISKVIEIVKEVFLSFKEITACELLEHLLSTSINRFSVNLRQHLKDHFDDIDDEFLSQVLDKFNRQCHNSGIIVPQLNLYKKSIDVILNVCADRCEFHFLNLKQFFDVCLANLKRELLSGILTRDLLISLGKTTEHILNETLQSLICYIRPEFRCCREVTFRKLFCKVFVREGTFVEFFRYINKETWRSIAFLNFKEPTVTAMCVILAKYLLDMQKEILPKFLVRIEDCLCSTNENLLLSSADDISKEYRVVAQRIINLYVDYYCHNMSAMIRKSMENREWMKTKEPTKPRAVMKFLYNDIQKAHTEIKKFWGIRGDPVKSRSNDRSPVVRYKILPFDALGNRSPFEERLLLNKLFNGSLKLPNKIELNGPSILNCLIMKTLKSFLECTRVKTFSCFSLQQVQVDICYLQTCISQIFIVRNDLESLFDEVVSSACNRTYKPKFMSRAVVSAICSNMT